MLDRDQLKAHCLSKKGTAGEYPFGPGAFVVKVMGKMFALIPDDNPDETPTISLKCDPTWAEILRQTYPAVTGAYHMNKKHWNSVLVDGSISDEEVIEMIDHSYELVVKGLRKAERDQLQQG